MGIYFDYDFEDGKEVEYWLTCYLCHQKKVLFVEYQVKSGPIYTLYNNARRLESGKELKVGTLSHLVCLDCYNAFGSEEGVVAEILRRRKEEKHSEKIAHLKQIETEINETRKQIDDLVQKLAQLYHLLEESQKETETTS